MTAMISFVVPSINITSKEPTMYRRSLVPLYMVIHRLKICLVPAELDKFCLASGITEVKPKEITPKQCQGVAESC